jgi:prolyl-tRNA editing enzyme YbaK/EbsC (Cys-tRNA(Pro) deacylase)
MVRDVAGILRELEVAGTIRRLPGHVLTADAAAEQLGCELGAIAKSMVFVAGGEPILVLTSGVHRVDVKRVAPVLGVPALKRPDPRFVLEMTGQSVGGVAPVGHPRRIRTVLDRHLGKFEVIWAGGGDGYSMFPTTLGELARITQGVVADIGR